jgi:hypothetical protein
VARQLVDHFGPVSHGATRPDNSDG